MQNSWQALPKKSGEEGDGRASSVSLLKTREDEADPCGQWAGVRRQTPVPGSRRAWRSLGWNTHTSRSPVSSAVLINFGRTVGTARTGDSLLRMTHLTSHGIVMRCQDTALVSSLDLRRKTMIPHDTRQPYCCCPFSA
ncbi:hypothetical protein E2C01_050595 [Portunus trituberculatus]|uniref:Uncharacterized protein n=1 Tax=Portunus trituberculatus TaxID=210409 RepID=A0A5B7G8Q7_PORTR|nr:hypothetical protein [Portunus trituberculatus]